MSLPRYRQPWALVQQLLLTRQPLAPLSSHMYQVLLSPSPSCSVPLVGWCLLAPMDHSGHWPPWTLELHGPSPGLAGFTVQRAPSRVQLDLSRPRFPVSPQTWYSCHYPQQVEGYLCSCSGHGSLHPGFSHTLHTHQHIPDSSVHTHRADTISPDHPSKSQLSSELPCPGSESLSSTRQPYQAVGLSPPGLLVAPHQLLGLTWPSTYR